MYTLKTNCFEEYKCQLGHILLVDFCKCFGVFKFDLVMPKGTKKDAQNGLLIYLTYSCIYIGTLGFPILHYHIRLYSV